MWCILLVLVTGTHSAHVARNDSNVLVTYEGHAEAVRSVPKPKATGTNKTDSGTKTGTSRRVDHGSSKRVDHDDADSDYLEHRNSKIKPTEANPEVMFIPSGNKEEREYSRRSHVKPKEEVRLKDVVEKQTLGDIIHNRVVKVETESPQEGILFISGKNNENFEQTIKQEEEVRKSNKAAKEFKKAAEAPLNCKNLNCDNDLASICGVKMDQNKPKYRLFLNECYFRKVNCAFTYEINRYAMAPPEKCIHVGSHSNNRHMGFSAFPLAMPPVAVRRRIEDQDTNQDSRRNFSSRRALSTNLDGALCAHDCPVHCPEDYAPECGLSGTQSRMFLNHCQMDLHSCTHGTVWQNRPISECVGEKKADVHNNRAFIGWMQRIGLVDKKGKMVMS